jgi:anti-sigma B factor antagonist
MTVELRIAAAAEPGATRLTVSGEIDMSNADRLRAALEEAGDDQRVVLDLTGVEYLDSAGLAVLLPHAGRLEVIATPLMSPVLTISGLADLASVRIV